MLIICIQMQTDMMIDLPSFPDFTYEKEENQLLLSFCVCSFSDYGSFFLCWYCYSSCYYLCRLLFTKTKGTTFLQCCTLQIHSNQHSQKKRVMVIGNNVLSIDCSHVQLLFDIREDKIELNTKTISTTLTKVNQCEM